jgi:hypothetical protein
VNTAWGRAKARNLKKGARVALAIIYPDNPYRASASAITTKAKLAGAWREGTSGRHGMLAGRVRGTKFGTRARLPTRNVIRRAAAAPDCDISLHADKFPKRVRQRFSTSTPIFNSGNY